MTIKWSFTFLIFFVLIFLIPGAKAVVILGVKNKQVLIHLEGLKTKKNDYFAVIDFKDRKQGIVRIKRVAHTKAIGVVTFGSVVKEWSLKPISKKKAVAIQKKIKRKAKYIAQLKRAKLKRKLAKRRQALIRRKLASVDGGDFKGLDKEYSLQSEEVLSYSPDIDFMKNDKNQQLGQDKVKQHSNMVNEEQNQSPLSTNQSSVYIGISPFLELDVMKVTHKNHSGYLMLDLGFGGILHADFLLNQLIRLEALLGYNKFYVEATEKQCGTRSGCHLKIHYVLLGGSLKFNLTDLSGHQFWLALGGTIKQPIMYENKDILTQDSLLSIHGTVGAGLGIDFDFGNFVVPISVRAALQMPSSATIIAATMRFQAGIAYKF